MTNVLKNNIIPTIVLPFVFQHILRVVTFFPFHWPSLGFIANKNFIGLPETSTFLVIGLIILFCLGYEIRKKKQKKKNISEKLKENQRILLATQSILRNEANERARLARDLHNGLGGMLSGTKLALNNMKGNVILTSENVHDFEHALKMLDNSIIELRRVAHGMMPEALVKLGLKEALSDFCYELDKVVQAKIVFLFYGENNRIVSDIEVNVYHIVVELVNNAIKQGGATEITIQMVQETGRLCLIVEDNGNGFDLEKINIMDIGLSLVQSRVDALGGQMEINTSPGKGCEITIELFI